MKNIKQAGFSHVAVPLVVLVVAAIVGVGWYVANKSEESKISSFDECVAAGNPVMESYPEQCSADGQTFVNEHTQGVVGLDKTKIPAGWNVSSRGDDIITLDNSAIDVEPTKNCFIEVLHQKDELAKQADADAFIAALKADYTKQIAEDKGYQTQELADETILITVNGEEVAVRSFHDKLTLPPTDNVLYEKKAYIVKDEHYVQIHQSCQGSDFAESDKALRAITVQL